ncbi:MAG: GTPase ObgE [Candidatus Saccharibacteria bacterium]|nr:GTPase ObgE [Candidatus Saccharibacteria bacterium]
MFVDKVDVSVTAGDGGNGYLGFRQEKFVDRGGPDGGDGGNGGDVVFVASRNQNTLATFRFQKQLLAEPGKGGFKQKMHGRSGQDLIVMIPVGTMVFNEAGELIADLAQDEQRAVIAKGGKGGFGNAHFVSSVRQAPKIAEKGEKGETFNLTLEMKMIADVGVVGLPNAGKSTLLGHVSNARPEIADYPFTTIRPNLGVVDIDESTSLLFADIPGLIEGASLGKGLGDEFLRHIERTRVLIHMIDAYGDIESAYNTIQKELKDYKVDLTTRPQIVALNKIDGLTDEDVTAKLTILQALVPGETPLLAISASSGKGVKELLYEVKSICARRAEEVATELAEEVPVLRLPETEDSWKVTREDDRYVVTGRKIERFAQRTDFESAAGEQRLRDIMRKMGIMHELSRQGIEPGRKIVIGNSGKLDY